MRTVFLLHPKLEKNVGCKFWSKDMYNLNDFFTEILLHLLSRGARLGRGWGEWGSLRRHLQLGHGAWAKEAKCEISRRKLCRRLEMEDRCNKKTIQQASSHDCMFQVSFVREIAFPAFPVLGSWASVWLRTTVTTVSQHRVRSNQKAHKAC